MTGVQIPVGALILPPSPGFELWQQVYIDVATGQSRNSDRCIVPQSGDSGLLSNIQTRRTQPHTNRSDRRFYEADYDQSPDKTPSFTVFIGFNTVCANFVQASYRTI